MSSNVTGDLAFALGLVGGVRAFDHMSSLSDSDAAAAVVDGTGASMLEPAEPPGTPELCLVGVNEMLPPGTPVVCFVIRQRLLRRILGGGGGGLLIHLVLIALVERKPTPRSRGRHKAVRGVTCRHDRSCTRALSRDSGGFQPCPGESKQPSLSTWQMQVCFELDFHNQCPLNFLGLG